MTAEEPTAVWRKTRRETLATVDSGGKFLPDTPSHLQRTTHTTPLETLRFDEALRVKRFLWVAAFLIVAALAIIPIVGGDPWVRRLFVGTLLITLGACAIFYFYIQDEKRYTPEKALIPAFPCIASAFLACLYFGLWPPAPMIFTLGIYFFSLSASLLASVTVYATSVLLLGGAMVLEAMGLLPDRGVVNGFAVSAQEKLSMALMVQIVYAATFLFGRVSRRTTLQAIEGLEAALRQVSQREALLLEAQQDLERAIKGADKGRYSGEQVGPWRLGRLVGRGAMGEVYEGLRPGDEQAAAVKVLYREIESDPDQMRRFMREAEIMSQLDSPHVVRVYDVGQGPKGPPYIAMELLVGADLAALLRRRRRLGTSATLELVVQVASVLEEARTHSIVHRDLKPQNLFRAEKEGRKIWKVLDFGVSKIGHRAGTLTRGHVIGTPGYMAPEQARAEPVDHRADVFSLAVITYRALTGRPAFAGKDYPRVMFELCYLMPTRPGEHVGLPADVERVLALGLAKRPDDRFTTALELAQALELALEERLPEALRQKADACLARHPWGSKVE